MSKGEARSLRSNGLKPLIDYAGINKFEGNVELADEPTV